MPQSRRRRWWVLLLGALAALGVVVLTAAILLRAMMKENDTLDLGVYCRPDVLLHSPFSKGNPDTDLVVVFDVRSSQAMGWGYWLRGTITSVLKGQRDYWQSQDPTATITVAVYMPTFDALYGVDGTLQTPLCMGFRESAVPGGAGPSTMEQLTDSRGKYWELLYIWATAPSR